MVLHERRTAVPSGFVRRGAAPANEMITLRVGLKSNDAAGLEAKLRSVSSPGSSDFRQWLSMDDRPLQVKTFTQPSADTVSAFNTFASANGLVPTVISPNQDWVSITLPVSEANKLFAAQFDTRSRARCPSHCHLSWLGTSMVIHPTTAFGAPNTRLVAPGRQINARGPAAINSMASPLPPATQTSNTLLVTGYSDDWAQRADLAVTILKLVRPDIPPSTTFTLLTIDNGTNPQSPSDTGLEANLDIQYTMGEYRDRSPVEFLSVGGPPTLDDFPTALLDTTTFLDGIADPPTVMTTSTDLQNHFFGLSVATKICNGYMALGARGISVVFASGDGGVRGNHDSTDVCANNTFMPVFPASCPWVTSVGSTQGFAPEKAINFTGGGFSNFFPTAYYQTAATGRGYPDVSLQGWNFEMVAAGEVTNLGGGTSASAPTFASIIALINDRLLAENKPVLGFLNPFLYSKASSAFTDVTAGHNSGFVCPASSVAFDAAIGWDPLTGFGTPIFADLLAAALA
ncbi:family S53 protease-like protein [Mycena olivaceomarginata]|nr:family S53 protease-like protein [Mycena olivaceomarginata]